MPVPVGFVSCALTEEPLSIGKTILSRSLVFEIITKPLLDSHFSKASSFTLVEDRYEQLNS